MLAEQRSKMTGRLDIIVPRDKTLKKGWEKRVRYPLNECHRGANLQESRLDLVQAGQKQIGSLFTEWALTVIVSKFLSFTKVSFTMY